MKTMATRMAANMGKSSPPNDEAGFQGFSEYVCRNRTCVLSRFDRFSMAAAAGARCPVCGERAVPAADETPAN